MSQTCVVADAGPLIGLARIGRLDLLRDLFVTTIVPTAVHAECVRVPGKPGAVAIARAVEDRWLTVQSPSNPAPQDLPMGLGPGESDAIALALELACLVLLDDRLARAAARSAGVTVIGTAGVLLAAKARSLVPSVGPIIEQLQSVGYYFSEELAAQILRLAGEKQ